MMLSRGPQAVRCLEHSFDWVFLSALLRLEGFPLHKWAAQFEARLAQGCSAWPHWKWVIKVMLLIWKVHGAPQPISIIDKQHTRFENSQHVFYKDAQAYCPCQNRGRLHCTPLAFLRVIYGVGGRGGAPSFSPSVSLRTSVFAAVSSF